MHTHSLTKVEEIDPMALTVHALAKRLPRWTPEDQRFIALVEDIRDRGIQAPLRVDAENRILDGVEVWKAAKQLQLRSVPIVRTSDDPATVIVMGLALRKHYTKGALAYVVFPLLKPALEASRRRRLENLKKGHTDSALSAGSEKIEGFCTFLGFSERLFFQAKELHEIFEKNDLETAQCEAKNAFKPESLREQFERKLLEGRLAWGRCWRGLPGRNAPKGKVREDSGQLSLFTDWLHETEVRFQKWQKLQEDEKRVVGQKIRELVKAMPDDLRGAWKKALKAADLGE
jgi:hypothetical protein